MKKLNRKSRFLGGLIQNGYPDMPKKGYSFKLADDIKDKIQPESLKVLSAIVHLQKFGAPVEATTIMAVLKVKNDLQANTFISVAINQLKHYGLLKDKANVK